LCFGFGSITNAGDGFVASDTLLLWNDAKKHDFLCSVLNQLGKPCGRVIHHKYHDVDKEGTGYWAVRCLSGDEYLIAIANNGECKTMPCSVAEMIGVHCF